MKAERSKKVQCGIAAIAVLLCVLCAVTGRVRAEERTVKVGVYELENFHAFDEDGSVQGYDVDYLNEIADITGWEYEYVKAESWSQAIQMLQDGEIDILSPSQITAERINRFGFSTFPIGKVYAAILTTDQNTDIIYEDFVTFNEMTFGIEQGNTYTGIFERYAEEHGFTPQIQHYENHNDLVSALYQGEVDAIVANIMRSEDDMRLIGKAGTALYYYMFRKDDSALEAQLNDALDMIEIANSDFQDQLVARYFPIYNEKPFTKAELDFIDTLPVFRIACRLDARPLSYLNEQTGEMEGIYIDYLKKVSECSGIQFTFVPMPSALEYSYFAENDIQLAVLPTSQMRERNKKEMYFSEVFWDTQEVIVCDKEKGFDSSKSQTLAYCSISADFEVILKEKYPDFVFLPKDTLEDCFQSIQLGEADCLIANQYVVDYVLQKPVNENLVIVPDAGLNQRFSIVAFHMEGMDNTYTGDIRLMSVLNKAFEQISEQESQQIIIKYTTAMPYRLTNGEILYKFRTQFTLVFLLVLLILAGCTIVICQRNKSRRKIQDANFKLEEFNHKLEAANEGLENTNAQLAVAVEKANAASEAKSQFLAQMSHEIRTPMNAIIGLTNIAGKNLSNPTKMADSLMKIEGASKILLGIINDVLDMSAIESEKMKLANMEFDFKQLLTSVTSVFYQQCKQKGIQFEMRMQGVTEEVLIGDSLRVNQILMNLLSNAVKFTPAGGEVGVLVIQASSSKDIVQMRFIVSDTGCGMSEELQKRLFNPFEQEDATTARKYGGSGLGLAITRSLVNMMHGLISVDSHKNQGSVFTVDIPFGVVKAQLPVNQKTFADIHTLIVDDDKASGEYACLLMERLGVKYECAESGEAALEKMGEAENEGNPFNLCIIDWKMPKMDGIEVTQNIRNIFGDDAVVIIASAYDREEVEANGYKAGADYFIAKPLFQSSIFNILMKISRDGYQKVQEEKTEIHDHALAGKKALLAEDVALNMEVAVELLKMVGMSCVCAEDGAMALDIFRKSAENEFDVILLDINMPNMDGYEAARQLRALDRKDIKEMPIYSMTANAFAEDIALSLDAGMNGHISKPIEPEVLYKTLETAFREKGKL